MAMNRLNLLLALCALAVICCTSSCGGDATDAAALLTAAGPANALEDTAKGPVALANGQDNDEIVGKSASKVPSWRNVSRGSYAPGKVTDLKATTSDKTIKLTWKDLSNAWGYRVDFRKVGADKWTFAGFACSNSFTFCDQLAACTDYEFRVRALNCRGAGPWSDTVTASLGGSSATSPGAVTGLTLTAGAHSISASWTAVTGAESYTFSYRAVGAPDWIEAGITTTADFTLNTGDLQPCTKYEVRVRASNCRGDSDWTAPVIGWIGSEPPDAAPSAVTGLTLTPGDTSITANWDAIAGAESYSVQFRAVGAADWTDAGLATTNTLEIKCDFAACTKYEVRVRATNCKGDGDWSATATGWIGTEPPTAAPGVVTLTSVGTGDDDTISVSWDAVDQAESYEVSYRAQGDDQWTVAGLATTNSFDLTENLVECTFYEVRVRASNCKGDGDYSTSGVGYIGATSPDDCGGDTFAACSGGVTELTIGYTGKKSGTVVVTSKAGTQLFSGTVNQGDQFTVTAAAGATLGDRITLTINGKSVNIKTNCKQAIGPGFEVGKFAVLEGKSTAGDLCPVTPCPVCGHNDCEYHCRACKCKASGDEDGCDAAYDQCRAHHGDGADDDEDAS